MPPAKKKVVKKSAKKARRKKPSPSQEIILENDGLSIPQKEFINVYDKDPVIQNKSRISWMIVGIIMLAVIAFWFWSLKISMGGNKNEGENLSQITSEIDDIINEFKSVVGRSTNLIDQTNNQAGQNEEIEKIKNDVLAQIQINSDSANWPQHSSKLLNLSIKYPANWVKVEKKDSLTISSYDLESTSTPELSAKIVISKIDSSIVNDLFEPNYQKSQEEIFIDLLPAEKYIDSAVGENVLSYLLYIDGSKASYKISIYSSNKNIFENTINKILSTIDLL